LKNKINELESNGKNKNIRDLYRGVKEFKKCYQPAKVRQSCSATDLFINLELT
jgi:hypothetical protein